LEHGRAIIPVAKITRRHVKQRADMPPKALRRAVVHVVGYVRDGKTHVLEEAGGSDQTGQGQVSLRGRDAGTKKPAHQRTRQHTELARELSDIADAR
jgi:ABC-type branched-subunit amino acid transport system ATPase component